MFVLTPAPLTWCFYRTCRALPAPPPTLAVRGEPSQPAKAVSSRRSLPITPPPRLCSTFALQAVFFQTEFNFSVQSYCCLFMFYLRTMGRSCQTHVLNREVLGGGGTRGPFPHLRLRQHLTQSWLPAQKQAGNREDGNHAVEIMTIRQQAREA